MIGTPDFPTYGTDSAAAGAITLTWSSPTVIVYNGTATANRAVTLPTSSTRTGNPAGTDAPIKGKVWLANEMGNGGNLTITAAQLVSDVAIVIDDNERACFEYVGDTGTWVGGVIKNT